MKFSSVQALTFFALASAGAAQTGPFLVREDFSTAALEDSAGTGALWSQGLSRLVAGVGGGSGILGRLRIPAGTTIVLSTDAEDFSSITDPTIYDPALQVRFQPTVPLVARNGLFQFDRLVVEPGAALRFEGSRPARLYVRGECRIDGTVDVSGAAAAEQHAVACLGGEGGAGGPGGGDGGRGGGRPPTAAFANSPFDADVILPMAPMIDCVPVLFGDVDGAPGQGVPVPNALNPTGFNGAGEGGLAWPSPVGGGGLAFPMGVLDFGSQDYSVGFACRIKAPGAPGAGGANGISGLNSVLRLPPSSDVVEVPPEALGGTDAGILHGVLDPWAGLLRGGAGGGGGGGHLQSTGTNGRKFFDCDLLNFAAVPPLRIIEYVAASSAGGGGGGGALQIQAGRALQIDGVVNASGGNGGSDDGNLPLQLEPVAQAGGGGAGGTVLIQTPDLTLGAVPGRISVLGGDGGVGASSSEGGRGGAGFLRVETIPAIPANVLVPTSCPGGPQGCVPDNYVDAPVFPDPDALAEPGFFPGTPALSEVVATDTFERDELGAGRFSGAISCWILPPGNYNSLAFPADVLDPNGNVIDPAWDVDLIVPGIATPISLRTFGAAFPARSVEEVLALLGVQPVRVRFQAARLLGTPLDPCDVATSGPLGEVVPGSLTPWIEDSSQLATIQGGNPALAPNAFRFQVVFDLTNTSFGDLLSRVDEVRVKTVRL